MDNGTAANRGVMVRPATESDLDDLVAFNLAMAEETEGKRLDPVTLREGVRRGLEPASAARYFVATRGDRVVGALMLTEEWSDWRNGRFLWIQSVYVRPEARRTGVYRALHEAVLDEARRDPDVCGVRLYVETENGPAQATYEALGMAPCDYRMFEVLTRPPAPAVDER